VAMHGKRKYFIACTKKPGYLAGFLGACGVLGLVFINP